MSAALHAFFGQWINFKWPMPFRQSASAPSASSSASSSLSLSSDSAEEHLNHLLRLLPRIQALLTDAEEREISDAQVKLWLKELREIAHDADDVLDEYNYHLLKAQVERRDAEEAASLKRKRGVMEEEQQQVSDFVIHTPSSSLSDSLREGIIRITKKFDEIERDRVALRLNAEEAPRRSDAPRFNPPPTTSLVDESSVYGRDGDKEKIINMLLSESNSTSDQNSTSVIPIVGMGGVGKTTLVQLVYNDSRVSQHFSHKGWVCVSDDFDVKRLTKEIISSITRRPCGDVDLNTLQLNLKSELEGNKTLLVLDDVWNDKPSLWESLRAPFHGVGSSKIVITTRNGDVAKIMQTVPPYRLDCLSEDYCWSIFSKKAFDGRKDNCVNKKLEEIGRKIIKKCGCLPLAVNALGSLLRGEEEEDRWSAILESDIWDLNQSDEILPALRLSYQRMPSYLKPCFAFCSFFPKDHSFEKEKMIMLWIAQGYIQPRRGTSLEDIGKEYIDELLRRSLFQTDPRYAEDRFIIHDLIVDVALSISSNACGEDRYMDVYLWEGRVKPNRSITHCVLEDADVLFLNSKSLRALEITIHSKTSELPDSIGNLLHLRYLCVSASSWGIRLPIRLSKSISQLYNLQILDLRHCLRDSLCKVDVGNCINLQQLLLDGQSILPLGTKKLTNLRVLVNGKLGGCPGRIASVGELKNLVKLEVLELGGLDNVVNAEDAKNADFRNKKQLQRLKLSYKSEQCCESDTEHTDEEIVRSNSPVSFTAEECREQLLDILQPYTSLKELEVHDYSGAQFPEWIGNSSFTKLVKIVLEDGECKVLPPLGQLPSLKYLRIHKTYNIQHVGREFCGVSSSGNAIMMGFPSLEVLEFQHLDNWTVWSGVTYGDFPRLRELNISRCGKLKKISILQTESTDTTLLPKENTITTTRLVTNKTMFPLHEKLELSEMPMFEGLDGIYGEDRPWPKLCKLEIIDCSELMELPHLPSSIQDVDIEYCNSLTSLALYQNPACAPTNQRLTIRSCKKFVVVLGLHLMVSLKKLNIEYCSLFRLSPGERFPSHLQRLEIMCWNPYSLIRLNCVDSFYYLTIKSCPDIELLPLQLPSTLQSLHIEDCWNLKSVLQLENLTNLKTLRLIRCPQLQLIPSKTWPPLLQDVEISCCSRMTVLCQRSDFSLLELHQDSSPSKLIVSGQEINYRVEHMKRVISGQWISAENSLGSHLPEDGWFSMADPPIVISSLAILKVQFCNSLRSLSLNHRFCNLKSLTVWSCPELMTLVGLNNLPILEDLIIWDCPSLQLADQLPFTLENLVVYGCKSLSFVPRFRPTQLISLKIGNCSELNSLVGILDLDCLTELVIFQCPQFFLLQGEQLPPYLRSLRISDCQMVTSSVRLHDMYHLGTFSIQNCSIQSLHIKNCHNLESVLLEKQTLLTSFWIEDCPQLQLNPEIMLPSMLTSLCIKGCGNLKSVLWLENFTSLVSLRLIDCPQLQVSLGLSPSSPLQLLHIESCWDLKFVLGMENLNSLTDLQITDCPQLPSMLRSLHIEKCWNLKSVLRLENLTFLTSLWIVECPQLQLSPDTWQPPSMLQDVVISCCSRMKEWYKKYGLFPYKDSTFSVLLPYGRFTCWKRFKESNACRVLLDNFSWSYLPECEWLLSELVILEVQFGNSQRSFHLQKNLLNLRVLKLWNFTELTSLVGLNHIPNLNELVIWDCPALESLPGEQIPPKLQYLILYGCESLKTLPVSELTEIRMLHIGNCCNLSSVAGMQNLTTLVNLWIMQCPELQFPPDELLPAKHRWSWFDGSFLAPLAVHIQDCPGLKQWCQRNEISYFEVENTTMRTESEEGNENYALDNCRN